MADPNDTANLPDLSQRKYGWLGAGVLAAALVASAIVPPLSIALAPVGLALEAFQFFPQMDKKAKLWGAAAMVAAGAALLTAAVPIIGLGLGIAAAASAVIGFETQAAATYRNTLAEARREHAVIQSAHDVERNHAIFPLRSPEREAELQAPPATLSTGEESQASSASRWQANVNAQRQSESAQGAAKQ